MASYRLSNGRLKTIAKSAKAVEMPYVEGWISPEVIDRAGEVVPVNEWDLSEHKKNPVAFVNHDIKGPIVGRWEHPDGTYAIEKRQGGLWGRCYFNVATPEGKKEYDLYKTGFKKAFSPRFDGIPQLGKFNGQRAKVIRQARLMEVSLVGIGENQEALATYVKSLSFSTGKNEYQIPAGHVIRFGAFPMAEENVELPAKPKGKKAYFAKMNAILDAVDEAKKTLCEELPEGDERNQIYGQLRPVYSFMKSLPASDAEYDWTDFEKRVDGVFEGFEKSVVESTSTLDEAALNSIIDARVDAKVNPVVERVNEIQDTVARVDSELGDMVEITSTLAG